MWSSVYPVILILTLELSRSYGQDLQLTCPPDWKLIYASCYVMVPDLPLPQTEALATCKRYGGKLVQPLGYDVTEKIGESVKTESPQTTRFWTDFHRVGASSLTNGFWSDGQETTVDVMVWGANEPQVNAGNCAYLQLTDGAWKAHMGKCDTLMPFMCQATPCPTGTFRCDSGKCVGSGMECNGENNCGDFSDERNCGNKCSYYLTGTSGEVTHPDSSAQYTERSTCQWVIEGRLGSHVQISFLSLETEKNLDFVEIWVGGRTISTSTFLYRLSGNNVDNSDYIISPNNFIIVRFVSDFSKQYGGFRFQWRSDFKCSMLSLPNTSQGPNLDTASRIVSISVADCQTKCSDTDTCVAFTYLKEKRDCLLFSVMPDTVSDTCCDLYVKTCPGQKGSEILPSIPNLGGTLYAEVTPKRFFSPLYPVYYLSGATVAWTIIATGKRVVSLEVLDVDLPASDQVKVFDGDGPSSTLVGTISQASSNHNFISTGTTLYVLFRSSELDNTKRGFLISYQSGCDITLSALSGTITSPGYGTQPYPNILSCSWLVTTSLPLTLTFENNFGLENGKDYLQVFEGSSASNPPKHTGSGFTGPTSPTTLFFENGQVFIRMLTSATGTDVGFSANFTSGCPPITVANLEVEPVAYSRYYRDQAVVSCKEGYIFSSPSLASESNVQITCGPDSKWSITPLPTCSRVFCGLPPQVDNGYLVSVEGLYGDQRATYACNSGYTASKTSVTCLSSGSWEQKPTCTATSCAPLPVFLRGSLSYLKGNGQQHGSIARYVCNVGYEIIGEDTLECSQGRWSANPPTCEKVECTLPYVANARLIPGQNVFVNDVVTVSCNSGYRLVGTQQQFLCGKDTPPTCENIDECATGQSQCSHLCTDTDGGYICSCRPGYTPTISGSPFCDDINECALSIDNCEVGCENTVGSYRCTCPAGYELFTQNGQGGIVLPQGELGDKEWNLYHFNHTCIRTQCVSPTTLSISNAQALTIQTTFYVGDQISYRCAMGYVPQGGTTLTCTSATTWNPSSVSCVQAMCPPFTVSSGSANAPTISPTTSIPYGAHFTLTCDTTTERRPCIYDRQTDSYRVSSTNPSCASLDCGVPTRYPGTLSYDYTCTVSGCAFTFRCRSPMFTLLGSSSLQGNQNVRCGIDGHWDFGDLRCKGPTCPDPKTPPGGQMLADSYEEYSLVTYRCERGFLPTNPYPLLCQYNPQTLTLEWNGTRPDCTDQSAPTFNNCPTGNQHVRLYNTIPGTNPGAVDNVNPLKSTSVNPQNFYVGVTKVSSDMVVVYRATDLAGNVGTCVINIFVIDEEPPVLTCQPSFVHEINSEFDQQTFDTTTFASATDNSGSVNIAFSISELRFDKRHIGSVNTVFVTATDPSGNEAKCITQVVVEGPTCQRWTVSVDNAQTSCFNVLNGYVCTVTCSSGYTVFESQGSQSYNMSCTFGSGWNSPPPRCVPEKIIPYRVAPMLRYILGTAITPDCVTTYTTMLETQMASVMSYLNTLCQGLQVTVNIPTSHNQIDVTTLSRELTAIFNFELGPEGQELSVKRQCSNSIQNIFTTIPAGNDPLSGIRQLNSIGSCIASQTATYMGTAAEGQACYNMEKIRVQGSTTTCVRCAAGYHLQGGQCIMCSPGYYRDMAASACVPCPSESQNSNSGITSEAECYRVCPKGMTSPTGLAPCTLIPADNYGINDRTFQACPAGESTYGSGHSTSAACRRPCDPGYYSSTGLSPCSICPVAYYQPSSRATSCIECNDQLYTLQEGSISGSQCVYPMQQLCTPNLCQNGGTCRIVDHNYYCDCTPNYTGQTCGTRLFACDALPCYNNGNCQENGVINGVLNYTCNCISGRYTGPNCEFDRNDCDVNPCQNDGICQDKPGAYSCLCPSFSNYTGSSCTSLRDPCVETPCFGNAVCEAYGHVRRKCVCPPGYTGSSCNIDIDECQSAPCLNGGACINNINSFSCSCPFPYTGSLCETRLNICTNSAPCGSLATCVDNYKTNRADCLCGDGYQLVQGTSCQLENPCDSDPCKNGATCTQRGTTYTCGICPNGYEGFNCQHEINECDSNPCQNGATCSDKIGDYECTCVTNHPGVRRKNCEDWVDDCSVPAYPCDLVGTWTCNDLYEDYQCTCKDGFYGKNCSKGDTDCASFPCRHGGTCTDLTSSTYKCSCTDGYTGVNCETKIDYCAASPCFIGSTCISTSTGYVCNCPPRYMGSTCASVYDVCNIAQPCIGPGSNCTDNGYSVNCDCATGYGGDNCETKTVECTSSTCQYGGTCSDVNGVISCRCPPGTTGDLCQTNIDDCASDPCPSGSKCEDHINSFTCQCQADKIGETCSKDLSNDFDVVFLGSSSYPADFVSNPQQLGSQSVTLSAWVRYTTGSSPGIIATLYGISSSGTDELLRIENDRVLVLFPGISNTGAEQRFPVISDDGLWHFLSVVWRADARELSVYVDGVYIGIRSYSEATNIPDSVWLVLGGSYDSSKRVIDQSQGMEGRLSRLSVVPQALSSSDIDEMYKNIDQVPANAVLGFTSDMVDGLNGHLDYNSELTQGICRSSSNCRSLGQVQSNPSIASCPSDQLRVGPRVSTPEWDAPQFNGASSIRTNYVSGATDMGWGTYGIAYAGSDADGNAAMCTFLLFNRRSGCSVPEQPLLGQSTCIVIDGGYRCSVNCNNNNNNINVVSQPSPKYYSCGVYSMYDQADSPLPFEYPVCSSCTTPKLDLNLTVDFILTSQTFCTTSLQASLQEQVRQALGNINSQWQYELCNAPTCEGIDITSRCGQDTRIIMVKVVLRAVKRSLSNSQSQSKPPSEILAAAIVDDLIFDFTIAGPDISTYFLASLPACDEGRQLIGDCCVQCAQGTYFSPAGSTCVKCARGSYLSVVGQIATGSSSPCQSCTGGKTTPTTGAQAEEECRDSCNFGEFYNLTLGRCENCPIGFYASSVGSFYCEPCDITLTTASTGATALSQCADTFQATTTVSPVTPSVGASTAGTDSWILIVIAIIIVLLLILLIILLICCCCRGAIEKCCPCLITKVVPEGVSKWHYVDRFGETNMKFVSYKMGDYRAQKNDKQALVSETGSEDGSVATNISIHVPVFEEKLNGTPQSAKQTDIPIAHSSNDHKLLTKDLANGEYRGITPMPPIDEVKESPYGDSLVNRALDHNGLSPNIEQNGVPPSSTQFGRASPSNMSRASAYSDYDRHDDHISYADQNLINSQTELLKNEEGALSDSDNAAYPRNETRGVTPIPIRSAKSQEQLEEETWATVVETDGGESLRSLSSSPAPPRKKQGKKKSRKSKKSKTKTQPPPTQSPSHPSRTASAPAGKKSRPRTAVSSKGPRAHSTKKGRR